MKFPVFVLYEKFEIKKERAIKPVPIFCAFFLIDVGVLKFFLFENSAIIIVGI